MACGHDIMLDQPAELATILDTLGSGCSACWLTNGGTIKHSPLFDQGGSMKEYVTATLVSAPPEPVWAILINGAAYADWNPEIVAVDGAMGLGARITAHVRLGDGAIRRVTQRIRAFEAPHHMEWVGGLPLGLFVGRRVFTLTPVASGTEFRMHLYMHGPLSAMILKSVGDRQPSIDGFSAGLRRHAERE
jgi:uncharacterized protein YndB with AHSA1/START domain